MTTRDRFSTKQPERNTTAAVPFSDTHNESSPSARCRRDLVARLLSCAQARPDVTAVSDPKGRSLTYKELWARASLLQVQIRALQRITGPRIAVVAERNSNLIVGAVAAAMSGSSCVVLSPAMWRSDLTRATANKLVLAESCFANDFANCATLVIDGECGHDVDRAVLLTPLVTESEPADPSFLMHDTGDEIAGAAMAQFVATLEQLGFSGRRVAQIAAPQTRAFVFEMWVALAQGGTLCIVPDATTSIDALACGLKAECDERAPVAVVLTTLGTDALIAHRNQPLATIAGLVVLGTGFEATPCHVLAQLAAEKPVITTVHVDGTRPVWVGRVSATARGNVLVAAGSALAGTSLVVTTADGAEAARAQVGDLCVRGGSGAPAPTGARGRVTLDGRLEVYVSKASEPEFALSPSQQRVWFLEQLDSGRGAYNLPLACRISGPLDVLALERALREMVARHEVLRSVFPSSQGAPRQIVHPHASLNLPITDLTELSQPDVQARRLAQDEARAPFDLTEGPVMRARLVRLGSVDHLFLLTVHHISCDLSSLAVIGREISSLYAAYLNRAEPSALPTPRLQYADFAELQGRALSEGKRNELIAYWREHLRGVPECISLPTDRPRPPVQSYEGDAVGFDVPLEVVTRAEAMACRAGTTVDLILLAAFAATVHRYGSGDDIVIGTQVSDRHDPSAAQAIGSLSNMLALRLPVASCASFSDLLDMVGTEIRGAHAHQALPFEVVLDELDLHRDPAHSPVFQVMFTYTDDDPSANWALPGCEVSATVGDSRKSLFDLTLSVIRKGSTLRARLDYAVALFDQTTAARIVTHFLTLLHNAVADPRADLARLEVLPEAERRLVVHEWGQGPRLGSAPAAVHDLISRQAEKTPEAIAVADRDRSLTYGALERAATTFAGRLRALGVQPGSTVGVYLDRSIHTVVALLGILKAGGAYLPLDPAYPADRLAFMMADSGAGVVASRSTLLGAASGLGAEVVAVDAVRTAPPAFVAAKTSPDDLAYVIYTSGSTGRPKGVKITHGNLSAFLGAMDSSLGNDSPGTWLAVTSISFDISVLELLWTLTRGYRVIIRGDEPAPDQSSAGAAQLAAAGTVSQRPVEFSLFFFGNAPADQAGSAKRYRLVFEAARWADEQGFTAVWTPERHFHSFGGLYPNPSVLAAALAASTKRIAVRAGSVVLPLHEPLRVAEEWSLVDNLSSGRVGVAFASGWQPDDFVLAPDRYQDRKQVMRDAIDEVRRLWRGERVRRRNGINKEIEVGIYPRPIQDQLPIWLTSAQHPDTFRMAGELGANVLTHLVGHTLEDLATKLALYRTAWREHGHPGTGHVTLMLHTYVGDDVERVKDIVRAPLKSYIRSSFDLMAGLGVARNANLRDLPAAEVDELLDRAFERFFQSSGLLGTPRDVAERVDGLAAIGVDEVGCLIDFGVDDDDAFAALQHLAVARAEYLRRRSERPPAPGATETIDAQLRRYGVTHLQCTPSLASMLVSDQASRDALMPLRRLLVGGEALPPELAAALTDVVGGSVHNMYGPTEATVWATSSRVKAGEPPSIGRPLPGYSAYVVDAALRLVPIGVPGELLLGGSAISMGYHCREDLTSEKFVPDHFSDEPGARLYRTGDIARWRGCGELEFMGRIDHQVKLRGRRIELGEIEAALTKHPAIQGAVCMVRGSGDGKRIVAYLLVAGAQLPSELNSLLRESLPEYMLPQAYVRVDKFPLTPNGKIDRRALPESDQTVGSPETALRAPDGELEHAIAAVWRQVLRTEHVGRDDNFFRIGGNSILVVAVRSRLLEGLGAELSLVDMFRYPTIATLATAIGGRGTPMSSRSAAATKAAEAGERRRAVSARRGGPVTKGSKNEQ
jgi:natural product biosynthesis luciferase-like monooxygenase protein